MPAETAVVYLSLTVSRHYPRSHNTTFWALDLHAAAHQAWLLTISAAAPCQGVASRNAGLDIFNESCMRLQHHLAAAVYACATVFCDAFNDLDPTCL